MSLNVVVNGERRVLNGLADGAPLADVVRALALKEDRVAIEHNGEIARRGHWPELQVREGDRLEVVHFVGGGAD
jgi:sulfur carrier protein